MNSPETNDPIEKLLREQDAYVPDDGFTTRVMARVPQRRNRLLARWILWSLVVAGSVFAIGWLPWRSLPPLDFSKAFSPDSGVFAAWLPFFAVIAALTSAAWAAVRREG